MQATDDIAGMLRESAADFLAGRHSTARLKGSIGQPRAIERGLWREMAELGWLGLGLSEALGGAGMALSGATALTELFGRSLIPEPYIAATVIPTVLLKACTAPDPQQELAAGLASGERLLTLAWQETPGQLDAGTPATRIEKGRISGRKCFVPAVEDDSVLLVSAQSGSELVIAAVAANAPGVRRQVYATGGGSLTTLVFEDAPLLYGAPLLAGPAAQTALRQALDAGLIAVSAQLAGIAAGCLAKTVDYVSQRVQFGRPIGSFQSIQHRCVDLHIATQLAGASWRHALHVHEVAPGAPSNAAALSAAKARCGDAALQVGKQAVQMHGAMGFTEEADIGLYLRAALHDSAWLGGPALHRRRFLAAHRQNEVGELAHA